MNPIQRLNAAETRLEKLNQTVDIINMRIDWIEKKLIKANIQTYYEKEVGNKGLLCWDAENDELKSRLTLEGKPLVDECTETKVACIEFLAAMIEEICDEGEEIIKRMHQKD